MSPVQIQTMSKNKDEQFKLAHKVVDFVDLTKEKKNVKLLLYNVDKTESSYAQNRLFEGQNTDRIFRKMFLRKINVNNLLNYSM